MKLKYEVNKDGLVLEVKNLEGIDNYTILREKVREFPNNNTSDRWAGLKRAICTQELNIVMKYSGFKSIDELKRATNILSPSHQKRDKFMSSILKDTFLDVRKDIENLCFYVMRVKNDS